MVYDFVYLLLLLLGIAVLVENRLRRILFYLAFQGVLLCVPVIQTHKSDLYHAGSLISLVLIFKAFLTPWVLNWAANRANMNESTTPRFGFFATLIFLVLGLVLTLKITEGVQQMDIFIHKIGLIYVILLVYVGILCFIVRKNWIALIAGFCVFENGIFVLTLVLDQGLPFGLEFGSFLDAILVIVSGGILKLSPHMHNKARTGI